MSKRPHWLYHEFVEPDGKVDVYGPHRPDYYDRYWVLAAIFIAFVLGFVLGTLAFVGLGIDL